ncbi:MAG: hypothetical protein ACK5BQ_00320 [Ignavibacteria bacterium]|jgi:aspartate kinase
MVVMKFGGAALQMDSGFSDMATIVRGEHDRPRLVVVSAIGTTTRDLSATAAMAVRGNAVLALARVDEIEAFHLGRCMELFTDAEAHEVASSGITALFQEVRSLVRSIAIMRQLSMRTMDRLLAYGEDAARLLAAQYLRAQGIEVDEVDARSIIVTDNVYGAAAPLTEKSRVRAASLHKHLSTAPDTVVVMQGFVGQAEDGTTTTMGKESSNLTAAFLGQLLSASEIVIWTDVEGIRSIDPKFHVDSQVRAALSYRQARLAAEQGLKLIYPTMITPAEEASIPIRIASVRNPHGDATVINGAEHAGTPVLIGAESDDSSTITVMFANMRDVIAALESLPASVQDSDMVSVSADVAGESFRVIVRPDAAAAVAHHLHDQLCRKPNVL